MMTVQEVFNTVADHLLTQGEKSCHSGDHPDAGRCTYFNGDGKRCAIGCLISPLHYASECEGYAVLNSSILNMLERSGVPVDGMRPLLKQLQDLHDTRHPGYWPGALRRLAIRWELEDSPLLEIHLGKRNARFWSWVNGGPVKITLQPGESLGHESRDADWEEGFCVTGDLWEYDGHVVTNQHGSRGRDCDGGFAHGDDYHCDWSDLRKNYAADKAYRDYHYLTLIKYPAWIRDKELPVYDEFAQAAGY